MNKMPRARNNNTAQSGNTRRQRRRFEVPFLKGHRLRVPNHPTEFYAIPWFQLVLRILNPTNEITYGQIYSNLLSQLGITIPSGSINVRLQSMRLWGPTNARLTMTVQDVFDQITGSVPVGTQLTLEEISDYADAVNRARVGYEYSSAQQQKSLFMTTASSDTICSIAGAGAGSVAYITLMWRPFRITGPPPAIMEISSSDEEIEVLPPRRRTKNSVC